MKAIQYLALVAALCALPIRAFPPAPQHLIYGMIRDAYGTPLDDANAEVILETSAGSILRTKIRPNAEPGVNYYLVVPMDAGISNDLYKPTALRPTVPFRIRVKSGNTIFLPMEMSGDFAKMGQPGQKTRLNLTLGEDLDGDGLPDAWERAMLDQLGLNGTIQDFRPEDDADGDGLSNMAEYLAGTYAFDPQNGFSLKIDKQSESPAALEFMAIRGRTYTIVGSNNLTEWMSVEFHLTNEDPSSPLRANYIATDVKVMRVSPAHTSAPYQFYKLLVQ